MIASDVLKLKNINLATSLKDERYINYLIISAIYNGKNTIQEILLHINLNLDENLLVDEELLKYYLNVNYDLNAKNEYILSEKERAFYSKFYESIKEFDELCDLDDNELVKKITETINDNYEISALYNLAYLKNSIMKKCSNMYLYSIYLDMLMRYDEYKNRFNVLKVKYNVIDDDSILTELYEDNPILNMLVTYSSKFEKRWLKTFNVETIESILKLNYNIFSLIFCSQIDEYLKLLSDINVPKIKHIFDELLELYNWMDEKYLIVYNERFKRIGSDSIMTLQDIGNRIGITRERARQLESRIYRKIKLIQFNSDELIPIFKYIDIKKNLYVSSEKFMKILNNEILSKLIKIKISTAENLNIFFSNEYDIFYFKDKEINQIVNEYREKLPLVIPAINYEKMLYIEKAIINNEYKLTKKGWYIKKGYNESDTYLELLDLYFPNGYRINSEEDFKLLIDNYKKIYKTSNVSNSSRYIASRLDNNPKYCTIDRGLYLRRSMCPKLPSELLKKIILYIKNSNLVVYYSELYEKFKFELNLNGINNQYLLKGLLDYEIGDEFHTNRDFITYGEQRNKWDAIINYMRSFDNVFTLDDLRDKFPNVAYTIFQGIISYESTKNLLILYNRKFIYADKSNINIIKDELKKRIETLFETTNTNYLTSHKIFAKIVLSNDNFLSKINFEVDSFNLYSIIRNLFPNDYYYRRPIISKLDAGVIDNLAALKQYLLTLDEFDSKKVKMYINKMNLSSKWLNEYYTLCEYMSEDFVLVDKKTMVSKERLAIDVYTIEKIEKSVDNLLDKYYEIDLSKFEAYFIFPDIRGYEWNKYLLIGIINTYLLDKFEIIKESVNFYIRRLNNEL